MFLVPQFIALSRTSTRLISEKMERKNDGYDSMNHHLMTKDIIYAVKSSELNVATKTILECLHRAGIRDCGLSKTRLLKAKPLKCKLAYPRTNLEHESKY